jgi:serine/threonine protein kinase
MTVPVGPKYRAKARIGGGAFGDIYIGESLSSGESVAIKVEPPRVRPSQVLNESRIYRSLGSDVGIPTAKWYGVEAENNILVLELLGKSLETLFLECDKRFSLKTVLMIADQILARIEFIHRRGIIHRDVKPGNFVLGEDLNSNVIYVIDFGLSGRWYDSQTGQHIPYTEKKPMVGTARFTSLNTHLGIEQSRRDDLEGIAYVLIYLMTGSLPWIGVKAEARAQKYAAIAEMKATITPERLCSGLPSAFSSFLIDVRGLEFTDEPNYSKYRELFRDLFLQEGYVYDEVYDWVKMPKSRTAGVTVCPQLIVPERITEIPKISASREQDMPMSKLPPIRVSSVQPGRLPRHPPLFAVGRLRRRTIRT